LHFSTDTKRREELTATFENIGRDNWQKYNESML